MSKIDWKLKYKELRSKYMNAIDVSYRLGFEEGLKQAQMDSMQQQMQDMQQQMMAAAQQPPMGAEGDVPPEMTQEGGDVPPEMMQEEGGEEGQQGGGDELDQSMDELEGYVKSEENIKDIMKSIHKSESKQSVNLNSNEKYSQVTNLIKQWEEKDNLKKSREKSLKIDERE